jgi:p-hydroxybenzoate 3-monooxygenase
MTSLLHVMPGADAFQRQAQLAQLRYTANSKAAMTSIAENYVGLPWRRRSLAIASTGRC